MKLSFLLIGVCLAIASNACGQDKSGPPITLEELNRRNVIGELGLPLGTIAEIEAEMISGSSLRIKGYESLYLLKVTHVDGKKLNKPPLMRFNAPLFAPAKLPNGPFALYEMRTGAKAKSLTDSQEAELEKGYVGKTFRLVAYEQGCFRGIPHKLPEDVPVWADSVFHFATSLTILAERDKKAPMKAEQMKD